MAEDNEQVFDLIKYKPKWTLYKFPKDTPERTLLRSKLLQSGTQMTIEDMKNLGFSPYAVEEIPFNSALKKGLSALCRLIALSAATTKWASGLGYLFVGSNSATQTRTLTGVVAGSSSRAKYKMDSGYPSRSSNTITWRSTFTSATANFAWKEYSLRNSTTQTTGVGLNRVQTSKGTKASGETWTLQLTITIT